MRYLQPIIKKKMSSIIIEQYLEALKGYFKKEELSDKILHIMEAETTQVVLKTQKIRRKRDQTRDEIEKKKSEEIIFNENLKDLINTVESEDINIHKCEEKETDLRASSSEENFYDALTEVEQLSEKLIPFNRTASQLITDKPINQSTYEKRKSDAQKKNLKWFCDSICDKLIFTNPLTRQEECKNVGELDGKPLAGFVISFDQYEDQQRETLSALAVSLGACVQDEVFFINKDHQVIASTHLILKRCEGIQFLTASHWQIPCITEEWLWKCLDIQGVASTATYEISEKQSSKFTSIHCFFPVHGLILCISSSYFKFLICDQNKGNNNKDIIVYVNLGDSQYVELLIHSLYNFDVLKNVGTLKLLKVLEYADRFQCDALLKQGLPLINNIVIDNIEECNLLLEYICVFQSLEHIIPRDFLTKVKDTCSYFLANLITPLECCIFQESFGLINLSGLLILLKSNYKFLFNENSLIPFLLDWLEFDSSRQTEDNIKILLSECRYEFMSVEFLKDCLSPTDAIFSKWPGFFDWYIDAVTYPAVPLNSKELYLCKKRENRSAVNFSEGASLKHERNIKLIWINDQFVQPFKCRQRIIYKGYLLTPVVKICKENNKHKVLLQMYVGKKITKKEMRNFYFKVDFHFAILPGDLECAEELTYRKCKKSLDIRIASCMIFSYDSNKVEFQNSNLAEISFGTIDGGLVQRFRKQGVFALFNFSYSEVS
ncbi:uncharacterized protein LOC105843325 isoform X1 [Hydra vulgaris]|uniref:Uncharacterized protein LOC105843325 isoform X1 n=1 Tax=Hydra vulgaris TaxID=6087 RepID=A0ABM4BL46_HYDVU